MRRSSADLYPAEFSHEDVVRQVPAEVRAYLHAVEDDFQAQRFLAAYLLTFRWKLVFRLADRVVGTLADEHSRFLGTPENVRELAELDERITIEELALDVCSDGREGAGGAAQRRLGAEPPVDAVASCCCSGQRASTPGMHFCPSCSGWYITRGDAL
jgi:hypothetical protein